MSILPFHFKQFIINQDKCAMKVGTDAVLLGSWTNTNNTQTILDIGTGTGIIAIMIAQKSEAKIDAIDIDKDSCIQAQENASSSPWSKRISIFYSSLQQFVTTANCKYDLIVSNPPYFIDASKPTKEARKKARHTDDYLSFDDLIYGVKALLKENGRFCVILPYNEGAIFREKAYNQGLFCHLLMKVRTKKEKQEKRVMMEFKLFKTSYHENEITIQREDSTYTKEYIELTKDYYLGIK